jgi:hypothetical protein
MHILARAQLQVCLVHDSEEIKSKKLKSFIVKTIYPIENLFSPLG